MWIVLVVGGVGGFFGVVIMGGFWIVGILVVIGIFVIGLVELGMDIVDFWFVKKFVIEE